MYSQITIDDKTKDESWVAYPCLKTFFVSSSGCFRTPNYGKDNETNTVGILRLQRNRMWFHSRLSLSINYYSIRGDIKEISLFINQDNWKKCHLTFIDQKRQPPQAYNHCIHIQCVSSMVSEDITVMVPRGTSQMTPHSNMNFTAYCTVALVK
jgi:hypothetical protein